MVRPSETSAEEHGGDTYSLDLNVIDSGLDGPRWINVDFIKDSNRVGWKQNWSK